MKAGCYIVVTATRKTVTSAVRYRLRFAIASGLPLRKANEAGMARLGMVLERLHRQCEHVAYSALGLNNAWRARIGLQLAPQPQDLNVDAPVENILVDARCLQQVFAGQRSLRRLEERQQQGILTLAQRNLVAIGIEQLSATAFERPTVETVSAALGIAGASDPSHFLPPQHRADARQQLPEAERLDDVIVRTELQADDAVDFIWTVAGGDDDRHIGIGANFSQEIEPVVLTKPQIQNDQAGLAPSR